LFQPGFNLSAVPEIEELCLRQINKFSSQGDLQPISIFSTLSMTISSDLKLYPLRAEGRNVGLIGLTVQDDTFTVSSRSLQSLLDLLATCISNLEEKTRMKNQLSELELYLIVSSMLAQSFDLHEILFIALNSCKQLVSAEEASILLLDDDKSNFRIYHAEGIGKSALEGATFPADKGLAGSVLKTGQAEVINDVQNDPRFYEKIDKDFGYPTKNMIAVPLVAGEEKVGVLEVLNKSDNGAFIEKERDRLLSISEEIAFAIRNAMIFEYVVNSYCKQRQGQNSCEGCVRPLGSWMPCVKYREASI
ncbi:MAG: GAF domain-containing protein, partial [Anaerolineales bacterium]